MKRFFFAALLFAMLSQAAHGCMNHFYFSSMAFANDKLSAGEGAFGLPEPVFKMNHSPLAKVALDRESGVVVHYERPPESGNVTIKLTGSKNIELIDETLVLDEVRGTVRARFKLIGKGFDFVDFAISGTYEGESVSQYSRVYVRALPG